jgi:uncharacterized protein (DUF1697 family)
MRQPVSAYEWFSAIPRKGFSDSFRDAERVTDIHADAAQGGDGTWRTSGIPMIDTRVALLRGINVGTAKRVAMAELRTLIEALGYGDVRTLLNSGNVVFTASREKPRDTATRIEKAIATRLGVATRVTVLTGKEVAAAVRDNPLASVADNPSRLLLMAPADPQALAQLKPLIKERWAPEALAIGSRVAYLWCANGVVDSRLWAAANRSLEDAGTARNLATMTKLVAMIEGT